FVCILELLNHLPHRVRVNGAGRERDRDVIHLPVIKHAGASDDFGVLFLDARPEYARASFALEFMEYLVDAFGGRDRAWHRLTPLYGFVDVGRQCTIGRVSHAGCGHDDLLDAKLCAKSCAMDGACAAVGEQDEIAWIVTPPYRHLAQCI